MKIQISNIVKLLRSKNRNIASIDFSKYDMTIPSYFWAMFYAIIRIALPNLTEKEKVALKQLMLYHCYTPYCFHSCEIRLKGRGIGSGLLVTSDFDTLTTRTTINYAYYEKTRGKRFAQDDSCCLGDDNITSLTCFSYSYLTGVMKRIGFVINPKSIDTPPDSDLPFLGCIWNMNNEPYQTLEWFVSHFCVPSRFYRDSPIPVSVLQTYRAITICTTVNKGIEIFCKLIGFKDPVFKDIYAQYRKGLDPQIRYIGGKERELYIKIPLAKIIECGWRCF
jgi:hypothetical protein